ncbi:hypothetical protein B0E53_03781 [Micromonospora sp. MH33]|nr:hypothetical protein B0E53_03781 [Micromonospora sp. MH33]
MRNATRRSGLAAAATGALAAAVMVVVGLPTTAVAATVFSDNFEDGNTDGWFKVRGHLDRRRRRHPGGPAIEHDQ